MAAGTRHFILGTAGHIDHGKTSLIKALTGTDTDRLPEERQRGMTIELGFAELALGDVRFGVVDVPGHERFVRTMVAGATGIDLALIVVAADDSVMPQTREHVDILNLLGVTRGVVAISKVDLVPEEMVPLVEEEVRELLAGSPLQNAPICPVSSATGQGMDGLENAILQESRSLTSSGDAGPFRLAIDRVFTVQGRGTVVTGSALQGTIESGDTLEVWPAGLSCRVRALQAHGVDHARLSRGQRVAINVSGIDRDDMQRGSEMATPGYLQASRMLDVQIDLLSSVSRPLKSTTTVRFGMGTVELPARVVLFDHTELAPGGSAFAQFRTGQSITATYGQRFIIRDAGATHTLGGGVVLRPLARRRRRRNDRTTDDLARLQSGGDDDRVEEVLRAARFTRPTDLHICANAGVELADVPGILERLQADRRYIQLEGTDIFTVPAAVEDLADRLTHWLERYHTTHAEKPGRHADAVLGWLERMSSRSIARSVFKKLVDRKVIKPFGQFVCLPKFAPQLTGADEKLLRQVIEEIREGGFSPPLAESLGGGKPADRKRIERLITLAEAMGELVSIDGKIVLHCETDEALRSRVTDLIRQTGGVTVAQVREELASSRKYVVPFLEYLDKIELTKREGDLRVLAHPVAIAASSTNGECD